jgi:MFS family permease
MGDTLRSNPPLRRLLGAWLQSCVGTGAGYVALLLLTVHHVGGSWAVTVVLLCDFLPYIAFGSWFGALADRHSRRQIVVAACLVQAAAFAGLLFAHSAATIFPLALLAGIGNALQRPALRSSLPVVAGDDAQIAAALYDTSRWVGITLGPALAAGMFALWGVDLPLALNALSFVVAAGLFLTIKMERPPVPVEADEPPEPAAGVRAGLAVAFALPGIAVVIACSAGSIIAGGLLNVSEPLLATGPLHSGGSGYALLVAAYGVGMVAASALVARRGAAPAGTLVNRYYAGLVLTAAGMCASSIVGNVALATLAFAATGFANSLLLVSETQLIQLRVPSAVQGRLFGVKDTVEGACFLIGLVGAGALGASDVRLTLAAGAAVCGVCAFAAAAALRPRTLATGSSAPNAIP